MTTLTYPFREADVRALRAGDTVSVNGTIWTGRDRFHKHFADGGKLPCDFRDGALFHCGPVAQSLMTGKGIVTNHKMFDKTDPGSGWGSNEGRIKAFPTTISNCQTKDGKIIVYASEAEFTDDPIEQAFFGCAGVCEIPDMEDKMIRLARSGFKHHTSVGVGHMKDILKEAFTTYLHYDWVDIDKD